MAGNIPSRRARRVWLLALCVYFAAAAIDIGGHLAAAHQEGRDWLDPASLAVAVTAGLFWPVDIVAGLLLPR